MRRGLEAIRDTSTDSASRQLAESLLAMPDGEEELLEVLRDVWNAKSFDMLSHALQDKVRRSVKSRSPAR